MVYKNLQSNKSLAKYKKTVLLTKFRTATVRHNLTSYHLMYGYPRPSISIQLATQATDNQVILYIIIFLSFQLIFINFTR